jgi:ligand-binding sensor domain-containing protein
MKPKYILFYFLLVITSHSIAQNLPIGEWRAHLPFNKARLVTEGNNKIYCGAEDGLFIYNKSDNSLQSMSKINGLSDINLSALKYNAGRDLLVVGYENGNVDLISGKNIYNIADIKRKSIIGSKRINNLIFIDKYAYMACGFGIVVMDLDKREIKDSYFLSSDGTSINIYGLAQDGTRLYAASDSGVYSVNINDPNINFYGTWLKILDPAPGIVYNLIAFFNNFLYVNYHPPATSYDGLHKYENNNWVDANIAIYAMQALEVSNNKMTVTGNFDIKVFDGTNEIVTVNPSNYQHPGNLFDAVYEGETVWAADNQKGLVKFNKSVFSEFIVPNGPHSKRSAGMQILNNQLWVGHTASGKKWDPYYTRDGFSTFVDETWTTYDASNVSSPIVSLDTLWDFMSLAIDPRKTNHVFLGSRGAGLLEFDDGKVKNYYNEANSTLKGETGFASSLKIGGVAFDSQYNLWVVNSTVPTPLNKLNTDAKWEAFSFPGAVGGSTSNQELIIDSYGQKWMDVGELGLLVFDDSGTLGSVKYKFLNSELGKGHLPSTDVRALAEDKEGQIWIGTAAGVAVFYSPSSVLGDNTNFDAQQVLLKQDNTYQYLLATEQVTSIAIDGANRKWFGTANSGVYLMSADGTEQLLHFTAETSPLLSDNIFCIAINQKTGEVFIGTDHGIISYKGDAIEGDEACNDTYVYPNPVYHEYEGPIAIKGIMNNGNVKITDISGTLVYETTALGGQAIWNGKNFKGEKAHTGVYLVFCSDADGTNTCITKLLLFN